MDLASTVLTGMESTAVMGRVNTPTRGIMVTGVASTPTCGTVTGLAVANMPTPDIAVARIVLVVSTTRLVPENESFLTQIRNGLSISLRGLSISASWLIVAVLFVLPWVLVLYFLVWLVRRLWRGRQTA